MDPLSSWLLHSHIWGCGQDGPTERVPYMGEFTHGLSDMPVLGSQESLPGSWLPPERVSPRKQAGVQGMA